MESIFIIFQNQFKGSNDLPPPPIFFQKHQANAHNFLSSLTQYASFRKASQLNLNKFILDTYKNSERRLATIPYYVPKENFKLNP